MICRRPQLLLAFAVTCGLAACGAPAPSTPDGEGGDAEGGKGGGGKGGQGGKDIGGKGGSAGSAGKAGQSGSGGAVGGEGGQLADAGSGDATSGDATPDVPPPEGVAVKAFSAAHIYFLGTMDNHRRADAEVDFPAEGDFEKITLQLRLGCPAGRCDYWDRWAYLGVVNPVGMTEEVIEIARFITPYRVPGTWTLDVTSLRPLLSGKKKLRVFIDTWVGPGNAQGDGWLVDASFFFKPGQPERVPVAVIPLWTVGTIEVGNPAKPVNVSAPLRRVMIPADAGTVELRALITGHGQGNKENCAEFCPKNHTYSLSGTPFTRRIWRDDCQTTAVPNQFGTWKLSRAGWCPGAMAAPWVSDVSAVAKPGLTLTVSYAPEAYENTCREDLPMCTQCVFNTGCMWSDQHTPPNYAHSALLVVYKK